MPQLIKISSSHEKPQTTPYLLLTLPQNKSSSGPHTNHNIPLCSDDPILSQMYHLSQYFELCQQKMLNIRCLRFIYSLYTSRTSWSYWLTLKYSWVCALSNFSFKSKSFLDIHQLGMNDHSFLEETRILCLLGCLWTFSSSFGLVSAH